MRADLERSAREVLRHYSLPADVALLQALSNHGGFSGAQIWRVEVAGAPFCLRAWPSRQSDPAHLIYLHRLMLRARAAGLDYVPAVARAANGASHVECARRLWDLTDWMPGRADFHATPSAARLTAACTALARLHAVWATIDPPLRGACPALQRRLKSAAEWLQLRRGGWQLRWDRADDDPARPVAERAWRLLAGRVEAVPRRLRPWLNGRWNLQPCLCDVWHDHLLFEGDCLTGLIDYGAVKIDHPAVDLARLLGSLVPDDAAAWEVGLRAYRSMQPFDEPELVQALDETGTVLGTANWLRWLYEERRSFEDRAAAARRLEMLVDRLERMPGRLWTSSY